MIKNPPANASVGVNAGLGRSPLEEKRQPTLLFLLGEFYEPRNAMGNSQEVHERVGHDLAAKEPPFVTTGMDPAGTVLSGGNQMGKANTV